MSSHILFVDDEADVLTAFTSLLEDQENIEVHTAKDAEAALQLLALEPIDLVISDNTTPNVDGIPLLSEVRQLFPEIPRVLLTGDSAVDPEKVAEALGESIPILTKPWDGDQLLETVRSALDSRAARKETDALVTFGGVTPEHIERAERVRKRLQKPRPLGEILIELGHLTQDEYDRVIQKRRAGMPVVEILKEERHLGDEELRAYRQAKQQSPGVDDRVLLVANDLVTEEAYLRALCAKHGIPFVEPEVGSVDLQLLSRTSFRYLLRHLVLPLRCEGGRLRIVLADPLDNQILTELARIFAMPVEPQCATTERISEALQTLQRLHAGKDADPASLSLQYREIEDVPVAEDTGEEAVQIVDYLLMRAIQLGASDLHIEPLQTKIRVRVRVDGVLQQLTDLPPDFAPRVVSRLKILAGADIAERRLHQDGKIFVKVDGREIDIRMSSYVSVFGETMVLRLLDRNRGIVPLENVGFTPRALQLLTDVILESSSGLVFITGPTGSGKTTTLYSFIGHANDPGEKVITCEDPVEYVVDGIVQGQVSEKTGPTFQQSLRAIVRQDPDTIVVGEVRDGTTVSLALEAALTGHKVFSTFHTEDAVGAFVRLLEMGAEPFLVASAVAGVIAQRLVRRLCDRCRKQAEPVRSELAFLGIERSDLRGTRFFAGGGCAKCSGTGYKGRLPIHEVLLPNDEFRDAVLHRLPAKELRKLARGTSAFLTLQEDGILKASAGDTSLAEIISNAPRDTEARPIKTLKSLAKEGESRMSETIEQSAATSLADRIAKAVEDDEVQIPPLPELTIRLGEMLSSDGADAKKVADLVHSEPAVATSLLRIANSAVFGGLQEVTELRQAIARLGLKQVNGIVTALLVKGNFEHDNPVKRDHLRVIWDHSVTSAFAARRLAERADLDPEEAFLAGLLHDTGHLLVLRALDQLEDELDGPPTPAVLDELMELLHPRLGHTALSRWKIPDSIARVALRHEDPPDQADTLLLCVQAADLITAKLGFSSKPMPDADLLQEDAVAWLEIGDMEIATLMVDLEDELEQVRKLF